MNLFNKLQILLASLAVSTVYCAFDNIDDESSSSYINEYIEFIPIPQKIGQIFILEVNPNAEPDKVKDLIDSTHLGNVMFDVKKMGNQTILESKKKISHIENFFNRANGMIPFIVTEYEGGYSTSAPVPITTYPSALALAKINDPIVIYSIGQLIGLELNFLGIHLNLAPTVDLNINHETPYFRSFSTDPIVVSSLAKEFIMGQSHYDVLSSIKSFPGKASLRKNHNDPLINEHDANQALSYEWIPYQSLKNEASAMLLADTKIPNIDSEKSSLFSKNLNDLIRNQIGFKNLLITEPLTKSIEYKKAPPKTKKELIQIISKLSVEAFLAGSDLIQIGPMELNGKSLSIDQAQDILTHVFYNFRAQISNGNISFDKVNQSVFRIMQAKLRSYHSNKVLLTKKELNSVLSRNLQFSYTLSKVAIDLSATKPYKKISNEDSILLFIPSSMKELSEPLIKKRDSNTTTIYFDDDSILEALQILKNRLRSNPKIIITVDSINSKAHCLQLIAAAEGHNLDIAIANLGSALIDKTKGDQSSVAAEALFDTLLE